MIGVLMLVAVGLTMNAVDVRMNPVGLTINAVGVTINAVGLTIHSVEVTMNVVVVTVSAGFIVAVNRMHSAEGGSRLKSPTAGFTTLRRVGH